MAEIIHAGALDVFNLPVTELPLIIDTRDRSCYENSHVIGAINCSLPSELQNAIGEDSWDNFNTVCIYGTDENILASIAMELSVHGILSGTFAIKPKKILIVNGLDELFDIFPFILVRHCTERFSTDSVLCNPRNELFTPTMIMSWGLFLSSDEVASSFDIIQLLSINMVINVTYECLNHHFNKGIKYLKLEAIDVADHDMNSVWFQAAEAIHIARSNNEKVLVHCHAGKSRSASTIIYYLMKYEGKTFDEAFTYVKYCRPSINPNSGFIFQLKSLF